MTSVSLILPWLPKPKYKADLREPTPRFWQNDVTPRAAGRPEHRVTHRRSLTDCSIQMPFEWRGNHGSRCITDDVKMENGRTNMYDELCPLYHLVFCFAHCCYPSPWFRWHMVSSQICAIYICPYGDELVGEHCAGPFFAPVTVVWHRNGLIFIHLDWAGLSWLASVEGDFRLVFSMHLMGLELHRISWYSLLMKLMTILITVVAIPNQWNSSLHSCLFVVTSYIQSMEIVLKCSQVCTSFSSSF